MPTVALVAPETGEATFEVVVDGEVTQVRGFESNDTVQRRSDGTVLLTGSMSNGFRDEFVYTGCIKSASFTGSPDIWVDGAVISKDQFVNCDETTSGDGSDGSTDDGSSDGSRDNTDGSTDGQTQQSSALRGVLTVAGPVALAWAVGKRMTDD